jgi:quinol-cytochrome oxidoreductase complex cytochrome b subunit
MVLSYMHILKKIYLKNYVSSESDGWLLGGYAFFWFHYIIALGISLSASHLSDLTLTIVANIFWSVLNFTYKTYYIIFTNKHLNTDQLTRLMVLHYFTPWYYLYLVKLHAMFCHESWDSDSGKMFTKINLEHISHDSTTLYLKSFKMLDIESFTYFVISLSTTLALVPLIIFFLSDEISLSLMKFGFTESHPTDISDPLWVYLSFHLLIMKVLCEWVYDLFF